MCSKKNTSFFVIVFILLLTDLYAYAGEKKIVHLVAHRRFHKVDATMQLHEEIVKQAFVHAGYTVIFHSRPFIRALSAVQDGKFHAIYTTFRNKEREKIFYASDAYLSTKIFFYKKKDKTIFYDGSIHSLKPYRIGITRGWSVNDKFDSAKDLNITYVNRPIQLISMLHNERIDITPFDTFQVQTFIQQVDPKYKKLTVPIYPPARKATVHALFSKKISGNKKRMQHFNEGLKKIISNGTIRKIEQKYGLETGLLKSGKDTDE